jgi:predicted nucleic acid-binding protein
VIVDTGVFVAAANADEPQHTACAALLQATPGRLTVPALVVAEATYLIEQSKGPKTEAAFIRSLSSSRYRIEAPTDADLIRVAALIETYANLPLGGTDASIIALAERLRETDVATLDRRHFHVVRPTHVKHFTLLPQ